MTDTEIAIAALTDWPHEARPPLIRYEDDIRAWYLAEDCIYISDGRAIALFVAAGIQWLLMPEHGGSIEIDRLLDGRHMLYRSDTPSIMEPSLLSAIDAAIRSAKGDKHE